MKAIYDSGIPVSFKGFMVLKAFLMEAGYSEETRNAVDHDGNWNSDALPSAEQMVDSLHDALRRQGISIQYCLRMKKHGRKRSSSKTAYPISRIISNLTLMRLHSMDSIPDTMLFALEADNGTVPVPRIELTR